MTYNRALVEHIDARISCHGVKKYKCDFHSILQNQVFWINIMISESAFRENSYCGKRRVSQKTREKQFWTKINVYCDFILELYFTNTKQQTKENT